MIDTPATVHGEAALDAWEELALVEVELPSGMKAKVAPGSVAALMIGGAFPQPLMDRFLASPEGADVATPTPRDDAAGIDFLRRCRSLAAAAVKFTWHEDAWVAVTVTAERFGKLPPLDQREIFRVALGDSDLAEAGVDDLATFRPQPGGDGARDDGEDVRPAAVKPPRPNRAARRTGRRSDPRG